MHLLSTKFYIPPVSTSLVARTRLVNRLQIALEKPFTLIAAPAGSGKTTLLAEWAHLLRDVKEPDASIAQPSAAVAWLSLEPADNTPARFWMYIVAAIKGAFSTLYRWPEAPAARNAPLARSVPAEKNPKDPFDELLGLLQPGLPVDLEPVIDTIINTVDSANRLCLLVLDDYHVIENIQVHESLAYWIERQPPLLHLVIATRTDPPLPVHRLRARGKLNELRAADLRFSLAETEEFLRRISGVELLQDDVTALEKTTEGWAAGLQMAALALQSQFASLPAQSQASDLLRVSIRKWIAGFSGQNYYILDYLAEEVFNHQPEEVQDFLLRTAVLEEMCAELCENVIRDPATRYPESNGISTPLITNNESRITSSSQSLLEYLDRSNLFLVPLDSQRQWYRYHHLFADLLRVRLKQRPPEWVATLHARASAWYEQNERASDAVSHALAARDWPRAARLIEHFWRQPVEQGEVGLALHWLDSLPEVIVRERPLLNFAYCWIFWLTGQISRIEPHLAVILQAIREVSLAQQPELATLWCQAPLIQAIILRQRGDLSNAIHFAREAVERAAAMPDAPDAEQKALQLGVSHYQLAETYRFAGDLDNAARSFSQALPLLCNRSPLAYTSACLILSQIQQAQGHLRRARETGQNGLAFIETQPNPRLPLYASIHIAAAEVLCEQNQLEEAALHLELALDLGKGQMTILRRGAYVAIRLAFARGSLADALPLLMEAERAVHKVEAPYLVAEVAAVQARTSIALGELAKAADWAVQAGFPGGLERARAYQLVEQLTYARLLCAQGNPGEAISLLNRCLTEAESGGLWGSALEVLLLRAVARQQRGDLAGAVGDVERALALAEPEGYVRVFADEGQPLARLLATVQKRFDPAFTPSNSAGCACTAGYLARLLDAFRRPTAGQGDQVQEETAAPAAQAESAAFVEPLTEREMDVLRLLALGSSNREMADKLVVSEGTIKTHVHNLIGKLGAQSRTHAIALARQMKLI